MSNFIESIKCPSCGAVINNMSLRCEYCGNQIVINYSGSSVNELCSLAQCLSILRQKRPYLQSRETINSINSFLDKQLINNDKYVYFLKSFIEYDYYERKFLNRDPGYMYYADLAFQCGLNINDISELEQTIGYKMKIKGVN